MMKYFVVIKNVYKEKEITWALIKTCSVKTLVKRFYYIYYVYIFYTDNYVKNRCKETKIKIYMVNHGVFKSNEIIGFFL